MVVKVDTLRLLAQTELTENRMARKSDTKEIKKKHLRTGRRGGDGTRAERTHMAVAGLRLEECGTNGQAI